LPRALQLSGITKPAAPSGPAATPSPSPPRRANHRARQTGTLPSSDQWRV